MMVANIKNVTGSYVTMIYDHTVVNVTDAKVNCSLSDSNVSSTVSGLAGSVLTNTNGITTDPIGVGLKFKTLKVGYTYLNVIHAEFVGENFNPFKPSVIVNESINIARVACMVVCNSDLRADFKNVRIDVGDLVKITYFLGKIRGL